VNQTNFYGGVSDLGASQVNGNSFIGGGQVGYNWQSGNAVFGIEADFDGLASTSSNVNAGGFGKGGISTKMNWLSTVRGRLGIAVNNSMAYVTGGVAFADINNTVLPCVGCVSKSFSNVQTGWVVGAGVEQMLSPHWTIGLEGLWVNFGQSNQSTTVSGTTETATFQNQSVIARVKVNYKF
jgi:outer membrane immunogenic protein